MKKLYDVHTMNAANSTSVFFVNKMNPEFFQIGDNKVHNEFWQGKHIYFTIKEPIKMGQWVIYDKETMYQATIQDADNLGNVVRASTNPVMWSDAVFGKYIKPIGSDFVREFVNSKGTIKEVYLTHASVPLLEAMGANTMVLNSSQDGVLWYVKEETKYSRRQVIDMLAKYHEEFKLEHDRTVVTTLDKPRWPAPRKWFDKNYPEKLKQATI